MADDLVHITRIKDTITNIAANLDANQIAIATNVNAQGYKPFIWEDDSTNQYQATAIGQSATLGELTLTDDLLIDEYIKLSSGETNNIRIEAGKITVTSAGVSSMFFEDDKVYTPLDVGIGTEEPSKLLDLEQEGNIKEITDLLELTNSANAADMDGTGIGILFNLTEYDAVTPVVIPAGRITVDTPYDINTTDPSDNTRMTLYVRNALLGVLIPGLVMDHESMQLYTGNVVRVYLNSSGNMGVGVSPELYNTDLDAVQIGNYGAIVASSGTDAGGYTQISHNFYRSSAPADRTINTNSDEASIFKMMNGAFTWASAVAQTAGTVTMVEKMVLTLGGYLGIGATTPVSLTEIQGGLTTVGAVLTLGTKETTVDTNDVLGRINFYAPLEASGTDALLVGASIVAVAEAEFSASVNATSLQFQTGASEVAATKMWLTSTGKLGIGATPTYQLNIVNSYDGTTFGWIKNTNGGSSSQVGWVAESESGNLMSIQALSTGVAAPYTKKGLISSAGNSGMVIEQAGDFPIDFYSNSVKVASVVDTEFVINEDARNVDFRWEADGDANGLFCDASARFGSGCVCVGTSDSSNNYDNAILSIGTPTNTLQVVDFVVGGTITQLVGASTTNFITLSDGGSRTVRVPCYLPS